MKPMAAVQPPPWSTVALIALALCFALLLAQTLVIVLGRRLRRGRIVLRARTAAEGERRAHAFLEARGFTIEGAQVASEYALRVDNEETVIGIRADYLVWKGGRRYVVEVKTGTVAPRVQTPATRRQLLEYAVAFEVDSVLLLDMSQGTLREVSFPQRKAANAGANASWGSALALWLGWGGCALAVAWALLR